jgi:hypothetical protein
MQNLLTAKSAKEFRKGRKEGRDQIGRRNLDLARASPAGYHSALLARADFKDNL